MVAQEKESTEKASGTAALAEVHSPKKKKGEPKEEKKTPLGKPESLAGNEGPAEHP